MRPRPSAGLVVLAAFLASSCGPDLPPMPPSTPFSWSQDARWETYEAAFREARAAGCESVAMRLDELLGRIDETASAVDGARPDDPALVQLEESLFSAAPLVAVCRSRLPAFQRAFAAMRDAVKRASRGWDIDDRETRERLYRLLYGGRAALEEALLQGPLDDAEPILFGSTDAQPWLPTATVSGVTLQSGDLLLSRGGAASSALIARGNDFPGNFSHVALVRVDSASGEPSVVEAHIERGVEPATAEAYLADHKLRILVLRPRPDLAVLRSDPELPARAADLALDEALRRHIPYDFSLDFGNPDRMFCSEVGYWAYREQGLGLWMGMSTLSAPGLVRWLHQVGVRHFETHEPSDLEYDPQLVVVAEWMDPETLWKDHVDNAAIDVLLEGADAGEDLSFPAWMVPVAAAMKAWSWTLNRFGGVGPVPEGMGAMSALRVRDLTARHEALVAATLRRTEAYEDQYGYRPPYWDLVALAREVRRTSRN
jgi:hypothetical protein